MDQISASVHTEYENGTQYLITEYSAECGCMWRVDMWGYVRRVHVCWSCMGVPRETPQFRLNLAPEPE